MDFDDTLLPVADGAPDTLAPAVDPNLGLVLQERYRIVRKLGEGGMGRVYEAEHILIKRRVAIKCLHAQYATDPEVVARFHREALAATSIGNEHIVEVTDMGRFPDGAVYMVLEFLEGRDLADEIDQHGPLAVGRAVRITRQICDALTAAHGKGIIHRDLKPENVYLIRRGREPDFVKVLDFGISKFRDGTDGAKTGTGVMIGTPHTMAPEQIEGQKDIDHRLDVYAIGVILYMALVGGPPFRAETIPMLVYQVCMVPPPPLRPRRPDVPEALEQVVLRCLAKDRAGRYDDCAALSEALAPFEAMDVPVTRDLTATPPAAPSIVSASLPSRVSAPASASPARRGGLVAIGVVASLLLTGAIYAAARVRGTAPVVTPMAAPVAPTPVVPTPVAPTPISPVPALVAPPAAAPEAPVAAAMVPTPAPPPAASPEATQEDPPERAHRSRRARRDRAEAQAPGRAPEPVVAAPTAPRAPTPSSAPTLRDTHALDL